MSRGFPGGGGQTSENCEVGNRDGVFVSKTTENVELLWVEMIIVTSLDAVEAVDVLHSVKTKIV